MTSHGFALRFAGLGWLVGVGALGGCATLPEESASARPRGPVYKPGQSIADARLCSCTVCAEASCCHGETATSAEEPEFGISLSSCSRCTRRVWTARADDPCSALADPECCGGTVSD